MPIISVNITRVDGVDNFSKRIELLSKTVFFTIENFKIVDYLGIVTGVALAEEKIVMGFSMSKYLNSIRNYIQVDTYETKRAKTGVPA